MCGTSSQVRSVIQYQSVTTKRHLPTHHDSFDSSMATVAPMKASAKLASNDKILVEALAGARAPSFARFNFFRCSLFQFVFDRAFATDARFFFSQARLEASQRRWHFIHSIPSRLGYRLRPSLRKDARRVRVKAEGSRGVTVCTQGGCGDSCASHRMKVPQPCTAERQQSHYTLFRLVSCTFTRSVRSRGRMRSGADKRLASARRFSQRRWLVAVMCS